MDIEKVELGVLVVGEKQGRVCSYREVIRLLVQVYGCFNKLGSNGIESKWIRLGVEVGSVGVGVNFCLIDVNLRFEMFVGNLGSDVQGVVGCVRFVVYMYICWMCILVCWLYVKFWERVLKMRSGDRNVRKIMFRVSRGDEDSQLVGQ